MTEMGENESYAERFAGSSEQAKNAWEATIQDMKGMAAELEEEAGRRQRSRPWILRRTPRKLVTPIDSGSFT
ncbi:hypothetical protein ACFQL7_00485 [Halocatena marina]|uniref:PH domain-containing protein n=1 Tax=Halocatena marina TaxID=2934937 RepID=A0ABD5YHW2_9EURY